MHLQVQPASPRQNASLPCTCIGNLSRIIPPHPILYSHSFSVTINSPTPSLAYSFARPSFKVSRILTPELSHYLSPRLSHFFSIPLGTY
jgi:hypothetical protein